MKSGVTTSIVLSTVLVFASHASACTRRNQAPAALVASLQQAFNAEDLDATMALFTEDATVQLLSVGTFTGKRQISEWMEGAMHSFERVEFDRIAFDGGMITWTWAFYEYSDETAYLIFEVEALVDQDQFSMIHSGVPWRPSPISPGDDTE